MKRLGHLTPGILAALATLGTVVLLLATRGGAMFSPGPLSARSRPNVTLGGVRSHAETAGSCGSCHAPPWSSETMATRCLRCHTDIGEQLDAHRGLHGKLSDGRGCRSCHSDHHGADAGLVSLDRSDHALTDFPLTGKHKTLACQSCHAGNSFHGTPQTCVSCHAEPRVHKGKLGTTCAACHTTTTWTSASMTGLDRFDHAQTGFPLTGRHKTLSCQSCHAGNKFHSMSQNCVSCHAEPQFHKGQFGTACASCHSTTTWKGATFAHKFPINHGSRRSGKNTCATCHTQANDFHQYTCYNCHAHDPDRVARKHRRLTAMELQDCVRCHATGREHERGRGREGRGREGRGRRNPFEDL